MIIIVANLVFGVAQMYLISIFAHVFLKRRKLPLWRTLLYYVTASFLLYAVNSLGIMLINTLASVLISIALIYALFKPDLRRQYFTVGIGAAIVMALCELLTLYVTTSLFGFNMELLFSRDTTIIVYSFISILVFFVFVWIFRNIMSVFTKKTSLVYSSSNLGLILLPIVNVMVGYYVLFDIQTSPNTIFGLILFFLLIFVLILLLVGSENDHKQHLMESKISLMKHKEETTLKMVKHQEAHLEAMRFKTHDYKNHLLYIQRMLSDAIKSNDFSTTNQYINETLDNTEEYVEYSGITHQVLRVILIETHHTCLRAGIDFEPNIDYSDFTGIHMSDISTIFSNALDNAVEACKKESDPQVKRYIKISVKMEFDSIFIHISNSTSTPVNIQDGKIMTTKATSSAHGYGIKNIKAAVENYDGTVNIDFTPTDFNLYINIPLVRLHHSKKLGDSSK